jgi:TctA family transporter
MATSSPSVINFDLNLALTTQPNVMPSVWLDVPDAHPAVPAICPNLSLTFDNRPITLHDSVLLHDSTAVAVAPQILIVLFFIYLFDNIIQLISLRSLWYYGGW